VAVSLKGAHWTLHRPQIPQLYLAIITACDYGHGLIRVVIHVPGIEALRLFAKIILLAVCINSILQTSDDVKKCSPGNSSMHLGDGGGG
jgi:hypothetical protein